MTFAIHAITPDFVAEIADVDLSRPVPADDMEGIKQAFWKYGVLIFPDQKLSTQQHIDFAKNFGPIETIYTLNGMEYSVPNSFHGPIYERGPPPTTCY